MTPKRVADISEPIEQIYSDMTDELLLNIARHLNSSTWTWTALGEIETLETMGQLTEENVKIINGYVKKIPQAVKDAMNDSRLEALSEIEDKLESAALNGYLTPPVTDGTVEVAEAFSAQAVSQLNLVNQTMLYSSLSAYQAGLYTMRQGMTTITDDAQLEEAQEIIDIAAGKTVLGTDTRTNALRTALKQLNANGITGFYDRTGRSWSAEAYVNMDIRTTVHNTYIQSVKTRQEDYGSDVFQVSSHAGARPLCYPYQGKLYSWGDSGGRITLGDGQTYKFESIKVTSYGELAGLFGINCGHVPYPMIPRVSEKVEEEIQPKEENDREYQESQQQRSLERAIRYQKRELEMLGNNATQADKEKLKQAQARMREFIKETGRTRRYDREQIVTESNSKNQIHVKGVNAVEIYPSDKISKESVSEIKNAINNTGSRYRIKLNAVTQMSDKQSLDNPLTPAITNSLTHVLEYNPLYFKDKATLAKTAKAQSEAGEWVKVAEDDYARYIAVHESKHLILGVRSTLQTSADKQTNEYLAASEIAELFKQYKTTSSRLSAIIKETGDPSVKAELERIKISNRSYVNEDEFMAEGATKAEIGLTTNEYTDKIVEILDKYMRND